VSAFKPKHKKSDMYDSNDEISEEEIQTVNSRQRLSKKKRSDSKNSMQYALSGHCLINHLFTLS
jgi:hypothetical protein